MNILIVDDDPLVCQSLYLLLTKEEDFNILGTVSNGKKALEQCKTTLPDLILMDIRMPIMDGIQSTKKIKAAFPSVMIMMLTTFQDEQNIRLALRAGAKGYLLKSTPVTNMAQQIRTLQTGSSVLDETVIEQLVTPKINRLKELTDRENAIVERVAQGLSNKEIAEFLFLSDGTVRNTLTLIMDKLELDNRTQLAIYYLQNAKPNNTNMDV